MKELPKMKNDTNEPAPILGSWKKMYVFVLGFLVLEIILFTLFTLYFA